MPSPELRVIGRGHDLLRESCALWKTPLQNLSDTRSIPVVLVVLDGTKRSLDELGTELIDRSPDLIVANLNDAGLALAVSGLRTPIWWISDRVPSASLGCLAEGFQGAWRESEFLLRFSGPLGDDVYDLPAWLPECLVLSALAGICAGRARNLSAHTLQVWLYSLVARHAAGLSARHTSEIVFPNPYSFSLVA